jgi:hypothetical protein
MFHLNSSILRDSSVRQSYYQTVNPPPAANPQLVISFPAQVIVPVAVALGVALGVSVIGQNSPNQQQLSQKDVSQILSTLSISGPVVSNSVPFIVSGLSFRPDGCAGIRFSDGRCYPLLSRGPCPLFQWIIVDLNSRMVIFRE